MSGSLGFALELLGASSFDPRSASNSALAGASFLLVVFRARIRELRGFLSISDRGASSLQGKFAGRTGPQPRVQFLLPAKPVVMQEFSV